MSFFSQIQDRASRHAALGITLLLIGLAVLSANGGVIEWSDNGYYVANAANDRLLVSALDPLSHPFYNLVSVLCARAFGLASLTYLNTVLLLACCLALYRLVWQLGGEVRTALYAVVMMALAHSVFWVATKIEIYLLHLLLILLSLCVLMQVANSARPRFHLFVLGVLAGVSLTTHQLTLVIFLPVCIFVFHQYGRASWVAVPGFFLGLGVFYPPLLDEVAQGKTVFEVVRYFLTGTNALLEGYERSFFRWDLMGQNLKYILGLGLSFAGFNALGLLPIHGKKPPFLLLYAIGLVNFVFALTYNVTDRFTFALPGVAMTSVLAAFYLQKIRFKNLFMPVLLILSGPLVLMLVYGLGALSVIELPSGNNNSLFRNDVQYFLFPYVGERSAERFVDHAEQAYPPGGIVITGWGPMGALIAAQALGRFQGRTVFYCGMPVPAMKKFVHAADQVVLISLKQCEHMAQDFELLPLAPAQNGFRVLR